MEIERQELERWRQELASLVSEAKLPVVDHSCSARNPELALSLGLGSARASTIRKRVREWKKFRSFCLATTGEVWPRDPVDTACRMQFWVALHSWKRRVELPRPTSCQS